MNKKLLGLSAVVILVLPATLAVSAGAESVVQSAAGSGERALVGAEHGFRTFSFSAVKDSDGNVSGEAEVRNPVLGTLRHFQLDCLNVFPGNSGSPVAVASGVVTSAEDPDLVGRPAIFAVQDNGEGAQFPPDRTTLGVNLNPAPCTNFTNEDSLRSVFPRGLLDIDAGNIQIQG